mgnify:FL=1
MKSHSAEFNTLHGKSILWFSGLLILIGFSRHLPLDYPNLLNFSPVIAIFLVGGAYFRGKFSLIIPLFAVVVSDFTLAKNYGSNLIEPFMAVTLISYILVFFIGRKLNRTHSLVKIFSSGILSAIAFHLITCSFSWLANPAYTKSPAGWIQAMIMGEPGYTPAYLFLRNSVLSTTLFSVLLVFVAKRFQRLQNSPCYSSTTSDDFVKID